MMTIKDLPIGDAPDALEFPHFSARFQAVIWRNWHLMPTARIAKVLGCDAADVEKHAELLGLGGNCGDFDLWLKRGFQTIIRRNWELLSYRQLLELLEWTPEKLFFTLKEDDFLFHKLGLNKPQSEEVTFRELSADEIERTKKIAERIKVISALLPPVSDEPFAFIGRYGNAEKIPVTENAPEFDLKLNYSYSALYGDPLLENDCESYPEGLFADYSANGVNGLWMQGTLYTLVPWLGEDEACSDKWQLRLQNLKKLIARAGKYGVKIYLYFNEPRSMPAAFFEKHPEWKGVAGQQNDFALCTSAPGVLEALTAGVERLFREVPDLGGAFSITMSENLTHCRSRWQCCPRCESHSAAELAAGVNRAIYTGIKRSGSSARLIAYDWAWDEAWLGDVIKLSGPEIPVMAVSETGVIKEMKGYPHRVLDYSISKPGPGKRAAKVWQEARKNNTPAVAKIQVNATWELSAVPYIPVPDLVEEHLKRLRAEGVSDLMISWTLGGYPGGNLGLFCCSKEELAEFRFGDAAQSVLAAWKKFSEAFAKFPFNDIAALYFPPQNYGPSVLLSDSVINRKATMIGFPFDDIDTWCGNVPDAVYPPIPENVLLELYEELSSVWGEGIEILKDAPQPSEAREKENMAEHFRVAEAAYCHFRSMYYQTEIAIAKRKGAPILSWVEKERELALRLLKIVRADSRIGFEASNHYYYVANDLLEKIINCDYLIEKLSNRK